MTETHATGSTACFASVIIAVYNDWVPLVRCLRALSLQVNAPLFEVLVVDDGSPVAVTREILELTPPYQLRILSRPHSGTAAARNHGIRQSAGEFLVFMDADCMPERDCLAELERCVVESATCDYFQLHLAGELSTLAGRAEELRLIATQDFLLQSDGRIRFLNTAGFALRRSVVDVNHGLFDERALRGEDTLLFADLLRRNQLPRFVPAAVVRHSIDLSPAQCLWKDVRCALMETDTLSMIAAKNVTVRVNSRERVAMLRSIWRISKREDIGRAACLFLIARQTIRLVILAVSHLLPGFRPHPAAAAR